VVIVIKEHQIIWIALTVISVVLLAIIGMLTFVIMSNWKHRKNMERLTMYQINVTSTIDSSIPEILSMVIRECFEDYQIKSLLPLEEGFINSTREAEIRRGLVEIVTSRLSSATLDKLSLYYNIKNIADIIADKVYITVLNYVIKHNDEITHFANQ
jgi:hypothetical protein